MTNPPSSTDQELDEITNLVDSLLTNGRFDLVNTILGSISVDLAKTDVLLTYLTVTLPAKTKLPNRGEFWNKCHAVFVERGFGENLWMGLEQE